MEKEISDGIKKIKDPKESLLLRLLIKFIIGLIPLYLWAKQAQINNLNETVKVLRKKNADGERREEIKDSLYQDCGKQLLRTAVSTIDKLEKNQRANDSIRNLVIKIK